ncbi:MAG: hypothetical protein JWO65_2617 [Sphingomonas bacterium]|jgi:hypothetical protein|nr:hypothetical protein [Sphingomonas bacterium]
MIRLTLHDGTRTQLAASDITDIEPAGGGAIIHRISGEPLRVQQNARTIETRMNAELAEDAATAAEPAEPDHPQLVSPPEVLEPIIIPEPARPSFLRAKSRLLGKTSLRAMIGAAFKTTG